MTSDSANGYTVAFRYPDGLKLSVMVPPKHGKTPEQAKEAAIKFLNDNGIPARRSLDNNEDNHVA